VIEAIAQQSGSQSSWILFGVNEWGFPALSKGRSRMKVKRRSLKKKVGSECLNASDEGEKKKREEREVLDKERAAWRIYRNGPRLHGVCCMLPYTQPEPPG
jgi:hypothetical protein